MHTNSTRFLEGAAFLGACERPPDRFCEGPAAAASRPLCARSAAARYHSSVLFNPSSMVNRGA